VRNIDILIASGTHESMSKKMIKDMFGQNIPLENFYSHNWREDIKKIGIIPADLINKLSKGHMKEKIPLKINKRIVQSKYDLVLSVGQVLPHEVVGMANYTKNIVVGCGGKEIINKSHYLGAISGIENVLGRDYSPVRKLYDYAENNLLQNIPLKYILTVCSTNLDLESANTKIKGVFYGRDRKIFEKAVKLSQQENIIELDHKYDKIIVYLDPGEFQSTWLGNKAVYRSRLAVADKGEIIIAAPGINKFGEDKEIDTLIRKYGHLKSSKISRLVEENKDLQNNLSAAAHLMHGSSEGRFKITLAAPNLSKKEIENVNYNYLDMDKLKRKYKLESLKSGKNVIEINGKKEEVYYIDNPATGLWKA
ncbi:MAG: lactate racemase domain-containing protein, partial [Halanaerobiales bacterium]|nr:lactate racemase domain-containing protein [Halanaerobiales bacterium]